MSTFAWGRIKPLPVPGSALPKSHGVVRGRRQSTTIPHRLKELLDADMAANGYSQRQRHKWMEEALIATFLFCPTLSGLDVRSEPAWMAPPKVRLKFPVTPKLADDIRTFELYLRECDRDGRAPLARILVASIVYRLRHPDRFATAECLERLRADYARSDFARLLGA